MLLDETGAPLSAVAPSQTPLAGGPAGPLAPTREDEESRAIREIGAARDALRAMADGLGQQHRQGARQVTVLTADVGTMVEVCISALDRFIDMRSVDANGIITPMPDSEAPALDGRVANMIAHINRTLTEAAAPELVVASADVLGALPRDVARVLREQG